MPVPVVGDRAPDFSAASSGGDTVSLADLAGAPFVLYFYPKDMTPGCTTEACDFRDNLGQLAACGVAVYGASKDSLARHDKFIAKHDLTFPLLSDEDGSLCEAWGVWQEKKNYGRTYMGIVRSTFLVDASGTVRGAWTRVRVKGHVDNVIAALPDL
jgi:thioredoxin-dependent peroxiredoxin